MLSHTLRKHTTFCLSDDLPHDSFGSETISELCWILYLLLITLIIITLVNPFEYHFTVVSIRSEI